MLTFELFTSDKCGEPSNKFYKNKRIINNTDDLKAAVTFDHVAAAYKKNERKNENYIQSNCVMFDVDNTDSDTPGEWITTDILRADFPGICFFTVTSRNHMKEKDGKAPRPKYHVYFPIETITGGGEYTALKQRTKALFTYFDKYAADTARFFFGNENAEVLYFEGDSFLAGYIESLADVVITPPGEEAPTPEPPKTPQPEAPAASIQAAPTVPGQIPAGERNATMAKFAFTMLKKYGDGEKSRREFAEYSKKCNPPLEVKELQTIWERAVNAYLQKIAGREGYIPPKEYAQWGEIQPIEIIHPPLFPFAAFPPTLAAFIQSTSEYTQTAPEMAGVLILGALGAVFQQKYIVESINKNMEQLSIYAVAVSPPAERKSEVIRHIVKPFHKYQTVYNSDNKEEISRSKVKVKDLRAAIHRAENKLDGTDEKREIMNAAQIAYDNYEQKHPLTLIADDTTSEALISLLVENGERIFIASGEGGVFSNMKGRYKQAGDDIEIYLKGHSGDYISVHRKSREPEILNTPAISLAICVQPYIVENVVVDEENTGKGLTGRIVFAYPAARAGTRKPISDTPPDGIGEKYRKVIYYALKKTVAMTESKTLTLSPEAKAYAVEYFHIPEKRIEDGMERAKSWNGKAFGLSIRIAALFHAFQCCEDGKEPADTPISAEHMKAAAEVAECLAVHAQKVFAGDDQKSNDALYLLGRIKRYGQKQITKSKMWYGVKQKFKNTESLNHVLLFLEERAYIKVETVPTRGRPAETIKVNPAFFIETNQNT